MSELWDRRKKESARAHRGLLDYCMMGERRSLRKLHLSYTNRKPITDQSEEPPSLSLATLLEWSGKYDWPDRAAAWDKHHQTQEERKWAERYEMLREEEWGISSSLLEKAKQMLRFPVAKVIRNDESGITEVFPADWKMADAARIAAEGSKLGRKAAGAEEGVLPDVEIVIRKIGGDVLESL